MTLHLHGVLLPDGDERDLFVTAQGTTTFDGSGADPETILHAGFLLPGLVDMHAHLAMASPTGDDASDRDRAVASAMAQLENGVLALREPGAPNHEAFALGPSDGLPRIYSAGRWLAPPGRFLEGFAREVESEELPAAAVEEAATGGWAKVVGDWPDEGGYRPNFDPEAVARAVDGVHRAGGRIAIHAIARAAIDAAIEAGPDSIEHGTELTEEHVRAMADRSIALVPTMAAVASPPPADADEAVKARAAGRAARQPALVRMAWEAGVLVLAGTDVALPHGLIREEVRMLAAAGLPPQAALGAASWSARRFLGLPGLEPGAPADVVAFDRNPLEDLDALAEPCLIVLGGRVLRSPVSR